MFKYRKKIVWLMIFSVLEASSPAFMLPILTYLLHDTVSTPKKLGINVGGIEDWTPSLNFLNQFRRARTWISQPSMGGVWDDGRSITMDEHGYVTELESDQVVLSLLYANTLTDSGFSCESGRYELHYEGVGTFTFRGGATLLSHDVGSKTAFVQFDCSRANYLALVLTATTVGNHLKNLTLVHEDYVPSFNTGEIFHPRLLEGLKKYALLRFMDWGKTNHSLVSSWDNRATPQSYSYATVDKGVSIEAMIDLANRLNVSPWICIPHLADDEYFTQLAVLLKSRLNPQLSLYVEYSNEVWNSIFPQESYVNAQGISLNLDTNQWLAGQLFHWLQTAKIGEALHQAFTGEATQRFHTVLGSQSSNTWFVEQGYQYLQALSKEHLIDTIAIAPYIGGNLGSSATAASISTYSVTELLDEVENDIEIVMGNTKLFVDYFSPLDINIIGYEGGQHLARLGSTAYDSILDALFIEANRNTRMGLIYTNYLNEWDKVTQGEVMSLFLNIGEYSVYGSWGLQEHDQQSASPKYDAVMGWIGN